MLVTSAFKIPSRGVLQFDFTPTARPKPSQRPLSAAAFARLLRRWGLRVLMPREEVVVVGGNLVPPHMAPLEARRLGDAEGSGRSTPLANTARVGTPLTDSARASADAARAGTPQAGAVRAAATGVGTVDAASDQGATGMTAAATVAAAAAAETAEDETAAETAEDAGDDSAADDVAPGKKAEKRRKKGGKKAAKGRKVKKQKKKKKATAAAANAAPVVEESAEEARERELRRAIRFAPSLALVLPLLGLLTCAGLPASPLASAALSLLAGRECMAPKLLGIRAAMSTAWVAAGQVVALLRCFPEWMDEERVEVLVACFARIVNLHAIRKVRGAWRVARGCAPPLICRPPSAAAQVYLQMSPAQWQTACHRIGFLNLYNPMDPDQYVCRLRNHAASCARHRDSRAHHSAYDLDLTVYEQHRVAELLVVLAVIEPGEVRAAAHRRSCRSLLTARRRRTG